MDFRVYVIIEAPILDKKYELLVPIDRRIHDLVSTLKKAIPELNRGYYEKNTPNVYNKSTGDMYEIKNKIESGTLEEDYMSKEEQQAVINLNEIATGTRLVLL